MKKLFAAFLILGFLFIFYPLAYAGHKSIVKFGNDLVINEETSVGDAVVIGANLTINGIVERNAAAIGGSVILGPKAVVTKSIVSIGGKIIQDEEAKILGDIIEINIPAISSAMSPVSKVKWQKMFWGFRIINFLGFIALTLLITLFIPKYLNIISTTIEQHIVKTIFWGLFGIVSIVPAAILLIISMAGIILIPLQLVLVGCMFLIGYIAIARLIGNKIAIAIKKPDLSIFWGTLAGIIILWLVGRIPFLGWPIKSSAILIGFGGVIVSLIHINKNK